MIRYTTGDILQAETEALVNTVNSVGVMGRGIALRFKQTFPANFKAYAAACKAGTVQPGQMFIFDTGELTPPRYIINFPTKRHWRGKSRLADIESGLDALVAEIRRLGIRSIAVPPLGCGLGGLAWAEVRPRIERAFSNIPDVDVVVFEPAGIPDAPAPSRTLAPPKMTPGRAALVGLMDRYLAGLMDPFVSLLEIHKLTYFMQVAGEPMQLRYVKALYGPYAENLSHVLARIDGYLISGYADRGDSPHKRLQLVPGAMADASRYLAGHPHTRSRFEQVAKLVEGFETPFGLELLSTVHWVAANEGADTPETVVGAVHAWGERKHQFSPAQIHLALKTLQDQGWRPTPTSSSHA